MEAPHDLVLFDLDGTLSDPLVGIGRSINYALSHFGHAELQLDELAVHIGPPLDQAFRSITGVQSSVELNAFVAKYRERYGEVGYSENVLYAGIPEALASFSKVGIPLGICTSKRSDFAEQILEMFGLRSYFRFVNGGEIGIHKWQQVEALLKQGLITTSTVMVGDRAVDLVAAHRNGLHAAGVLWGHGSRAELENERPRYLFASPVELKLLVGANSNVSPQYSLSEGAMSEKQIPVAVVAADVPPRSRPSVYPEPFATRMLGRTKSQLGEVFGLANFGVNLSRLAPGSVSALRHAHTKQDEFVYILQGHPTLHTDEGHSRLSPGMCAGFKAGTGNGHRLINETLEEIVYLEVGDRSPGDEGSYPDDDLKAVLVDGKWKFTRKNGTPYA